jgi:alpha-tubulin suppressor-like RCC1 family protein
MIEFRIGEGLRDLGALPGSWPTVQAPVVLRPCLIAMPQALLELLLQNWRELLSQWAQSGALSRAVQDALRLESESPLLGELVERWAAGDFSDLPPIELLPASAMPTAAGAYAISTGTIYLNADWLQSASRAQALAVLTEELGHHLDGLLNSVDTPGDEGELLSELLFGNGYVMAPQREWILSQIDVGLAFVDNEELTVEQSARVVTSPISSSSGNSRTSGEFRNNDAFAALRADGSVVTWGDSDSGGDSSKVADQLRSRVVQIFSNVYAFAALKADGSVVTWGNSDWGGNSSTVADQIRSGVSTIFSSGSAFAALKADGSVVTWGDSDSGGDSSRVSARLTSNVSHIVSSGSGFAALKTDGSVVTWGSWSDTAPTDRLSSGVSRIFSSPYAFAALKSDGSVVTWGSSLWGGDSTAVAGRLSSGVSQIFSNDFAFAALKTDGSVVTWGFSDRGGDSSAVATQLSSRVSQIFSTEWAFAALKTDGSVVTWGLFDRGGDSSAVATQLSSGVVQIYATETTFAALKNDGSVVTWGAFGPASINSSEVAAKLRSGVQKVFSTRGAFAALKTDGSVVTWGSFWDGANSAEVASRLASGVVNIFSNRTSFAALRVDGSVVTWGDPNYGGDSSEVASQLTNVVAFADPFADDRLLSFSPVRPYYQPSHKALEILAKDIVYQSSHERNHPVDGISDFPYKVNYVLEGNRGLYALGLTAPNAAPILVVRGTQASDPFDLWDDINPNGIGHAQFISNIDSIRRWIRDQGSTLPLIIVGHSLGGAVAQWIAADATANLRIRLSEVVTFNSPGIETNQRLGDDRIGADAFDASLSGGVTHYITSPDIISLAGERYINGGVQLFDYSSLNPLSFGPHLLPVLNESLPSEGAERPQGSLIPLSFTFLNSPFFNFASDLDFVAQRLAYGGLALKALLIPVVGPALSAFILSLTVAASTRVATESLRQTIRGLPTGVLDALKGFLTYTQIVAEVGTERVQSALASIQRGGAAAIEAFNKYTTDTWELISGFSTAVWDNTVSWTYNAWRDSVAWTQDAWESLLSPVFDFSKPFITTAAKQLFFLPAAIPILRLAASSQESSGEADPLSGAGLFSRAAFSAPASYQTIDVPIALSQPSTEIITLNFATIDGTAVAGLDYIFRSGSLQFEPGETEKIVTIELLAPDSLPAEKDLKVRISNLQNAQFLTSEEITVVFKPNVPPVVALPPADQFAPIDEPLFFALPPDTFSDGNSPDGDSLQYTALLANGNPLPAWLSFDPATQTFSGSPPAAALGIFDIEITATDASQSSATASFSLNIVAYDGPAVFSITGTPGIGQTLTAVRSEDDPDGNGTDPIYIWQASSDGRSWRTIGADSSRYTITASDAGQELRLQIAYTDGEGFNEFLQIPAGIVPLHPTLTISPLSADKEEGNSDSTNFTFRVTRSGDLDAESTARWTVIGSGDNPADAADFLNGRFPSGTVRFLAGQSARTITVRVAGDTTFEADETFTVSLSDPAGASIDPAFTSAIGTIRNDDAPPLPELTIAATDANKPEGFSGNTPFTFTVTRTGDTTVASSASWEVSGIGASPADAADFARGVLPSGTVRFRPGDTSRTITVNVRADRDQEPDERFRVTLSNPTGATITTARATGIIRNDDLIGTAANDTIIGTRRPEFIDGLAGQDTLTGGAGPDVFGFRFGQSRIRTPDRITDFRFGEDTIALLNAKGQLRAAPVAFSRAANNSTAATLADLAAAVFADADGRTAGDQPLAANAAALVRSTNAAIAGTYLLINNGNAGRSLTADLMVNITGFSGTLPALGVRPVGTVFG